MARKIKDENGREIVFGDGAYQYKDMTGRHWNTCTVHYQHPREAAMSEREKQMYYSGEVDVKMTHPIDKEVVERIARAVVKSKTRKAIVNCWIQCW